MLVRASDQTAHLIMMPKRHPRSALVLMTSVLGAFAASSPSAPSAPAGARSLPARFVLFARSKLSDTSIAAATPRTRAPPSKREANAHFPSPAIRTRAPPAEPCVMSAFSRRTDCTSTCIGGTCDAERSIQTPASGGGKLPRGGRLDTHSRYPCTVSPRRALLVDRHLRRLRGHGRRERDRLRVVDPAVRGVARRRDPGGVRRRAQASAAVAGGVACDAVTVGTPARVAAASSRRRLLAGTVTVDVTAAFQVGDTDATKNAATDKLVALRPRLCT